MIKIIKKFIIVQLYLWLQFSYIYCELPVISVNNSTSNSNNRESRNQKMHNLWPDECTTNSNSPGTCMTRFNCLRQSGTISGYCNTYGVCCETNLKCDGISNMKRTLIQSKNLSYGKCSYHFKAISSNVCQVRIDFVEMILAQPTIENDKVQCLSDYFQVGEIKLCGINTNQHIYIDFDGNNDLTIDFYQTSNIASWNLIVTQLECPAKKKAKHSNYLSFRSHNSLDDLRNLFVGKNSDESMLAPPGCLQYYTKRSDTIESFNFNGGSGPYMANLAYAICIKRERDDESIRYQGNQFQLSIRPGASFFGGVDTDCRNVIEMEAVTSDYLMIPESVVMSETLLYGTYYCGNVLQDKQIVSTLSGLFMMKFVSDDEYTGSEKGFSLTYGIIS